MPTKEEEIEEAWQAYEDRDEEYCCEEHTPYAGKMTPKRIETQKQLAWKQAEQDRREQYAIDEAAAWLELAAQQEEQLREEIRWGAYEQDQE